MTFEKMLNICIYIKKFRWTKRKFFFATSNKDYALRAHAALQLNQDINHNFLAYKVAVFDNYCTDWTNVPG